MRLLNKIKNFQSSFDSLWKSMDELYKTIILLPNSADRDKLIKEYGKLEQDREWYCDSIEKLIEEIDRHIRIE